MANPNRLLSDLYILFSVPWRPALARSTRPGRRSRSERRPPDGRERPLRVLFIDGGSVPVSDVEQMLREAGYAPVSTSIEADEPWRMVRACAAASVPPELILGIERPVLTDSLNGFVETASQLLSGIPIVVMGTGPAAARRRSYPHLSPSAYVAGRSPRRLKEAVRQALAGASGDGPAAVAMPPLRQSAVLKAAAGIKRALYALGDRVWVKGPDLRFLYANDAYGRDLGLPPAKLVGMGDCDVFGRQSGAAFQEEDGAVMAAGTPVVVPHEDGSVLHKVPITDTAGRSVALLLVGARSAAERQHLEDTLYCLADLVVSSTDAIALLQHDRAVQSWNPGAEAMYGYTEAETVGRPITDFVGPEAAGELADDFQVAIERRVVRRRETMHRARDGHGLDVAVTLFPGIGAWGELTGISFVARDISEQKRARRALHQSEERFRLMAETAFDAMSIAEVDARAERARLLFCNARYVEMSGYPERHLRAARNLNALRLTAAELPSRECLGLLRKEYADPAYWRRCRERLREGLPVMEIGSWKRPDGRENYHERSCVIAAAGQRRYLFAVDRDVTDALRRERELQQTLQELALSHAELQHFAYAADDGPKGRYHVQIDELARAIRRDPLADYDFHAVAAELHISYGYFRRLFRRYTDRPPHDYVLLWRMRRAARELRRRPHRLVQNVARDMGYEDPARFSRLFKSKIGVSPCQYRKLHGAD